MKQHTEKQPIDDLFARKLGDMSLPPSPAGFERLKARMTENKQEVQVVFWRNPTVQRYMAAAACLLLVSLFGWLYWPSSTRVPSGAQIAANKSKTTSKSNAAQKQTDQQVDTSIEPKGQPFVEPEVSTNQLAQAEVKTTGKPFPEYNTITDKRTIQSHKAPSLRSVNINSEPVLAQTKPAEERNISEVNSPDKAVPVNPVVVERVAEVKTPVKTAAQTEHVLEVTIAEPESLVAARQAVKTANEERAAVADNDKSEKEPKSGGLWQQVKRFKQGEVFARRDNSSDEDKGLLGRAYSGLKQSLEKDKPAKQ